MKTKTIPPSETQNPKGQTLRHLRFFLAKLNTVFKVASQVIFADDVLVHKGGGSATGESVANEGYALSSQNSFGNRKMFLTVATMMEAEEAGLLREGEHGNMGTQRPAGSNFKTWATVSTTTLDECVKKAVFSDMK